MEQTMPFAEVEDAQQLAVLFAVLDDLCVAAGIQPQSPESEDAAGLLMHLHRIGCHTAEDLKYTLHQVTSQAQHA
jgi:hypothetical protein